MNKLFLALILIICMQIVFPQNISGPANYKMLDAFASDSRMDTLISAGFYDYNNDGSEQIVYYFARKNEWNVLVRDTAGNNYAEFSGQIDTGRTIQKMKLFYYNSELYLTIVSKVGPIKIGLYVISLATSKTVDSIEVDPLHYVDYNFPYNELKFNSLEVLKANNGNEQILIGYNGNGSGFEPGEIYWQSEDSKLLIFNFADSLAFSNYLNNTSNIFPVSNLSYGGKSGYSYSPYGDWYSTVFSIYNINDLGNVNEGETLFSDSSSYNVISSDDSTNFFQSLVLYNSYFFYGISLIEGKTNWRNTYSDLIFDHGNITASANLSMSNNYYVIFFIGYRMWIIRRNDGKQVYHEYGTISPVKIIEDSNDKLCYLIKAGQQTYALYELENFNSILSVKKNKPDIPDKFSISQNYPNPFNPSTTIKYSIPRVTHVKLMIYDALGRIITTLVDGEKPAGNYSVEFDGSDLSSGVYFYRIEAGDYTAIKKLVLIK